MSNRVFDRISPSTYKECEAPLYPHIAGEPQRVLCKPIVLENEICTTMRAEDVTDTLELALEASGGDQMHVLQKPRLLPDNGPTHLAVKLSHEPYQSLTWNIGKELAEDRRFKPATHAHVYFYDPHSPWQRGSNKNSNRLLRQ